MTLALAILIILAVAIFLTFTETGRELSNALAMYLAVAAVFLALLWAIITIGSYIK